MCSPATSKFIRLTTIVGIVVCCAVAQGQSQWVDNNNLAQNERISSLDRRVSNIEAIHPDGVAERLKNLEERVNDQQKLLWGILTAVIVNLLTGTAKIPFTVKRRREGET